MGYSIFKYLHFIRPTAEQELVLKAMEEFVNTMGITTLKWQYTAITRGVKDIEKF